MFSPFQSCWSQSLVQARTLSLNRLVNGFSKTSSLCQSFIFTSTKNPELSFEEKETATRLAKELSEVGITVTKNVGGHGVVGILENGEGPNGHDSN